MVGNIMAAKELFTVMPVKDVASASSMLAAHVKSPDIEKGMFASILSSQVCKWTYMILIYRFKLFALNRIFKNITSYS